MVYAVRTISSTHARGGSSYLVEASKGYGSKYRLAKTSKTKAATFKTRKTAQKWASQIGGTIFSV